MAMLLLMVDGVATHKFGLDNPVTRIGRSPDNEIHVDDPLVSGQHAVIEVGGDDKQPSFVLRDLDSTNGSFVNDEKVSGTRNLVPNDLLRFGLHQFKFIDDQKIELDKTKKIKKSWIPGVYYTKD